VAIVEIYNRFKIHLNLPVSDSLGLHTIGVFSNLQSLYVALFCVGYSLTDLFMLH